MHTLLFQFFKIFQTISLMHDNNIDDNDNDENSREDKIEQRDNA